MHIAIISWNKSLHAYGMYTCNTTLLTHAANTRLALENTNVPESSDDLQLL